MVPAFLIRIFGERVAKLVFWGVIFVLLAIVLGVLLGRCSGPDNGVAAQAEQTSRSGEAISNAAASAIDTIGNRTITDQTVDAATDNATKGIADAQTVDDVRAAVLEGVCGQPSHRNDPACK